MASSDPHITVYNDDDDDEPLNDVVLDDDPLTDSDTHSTSSLPPNPHPPPLPSSSVSIAVLPPTGPIPPPITPSLSTSIILHSSSATPTPDSRKLFQRLWTDEDEIEILQGFLEYTSQRGTNWSGYHHDTTAFYDQIKSRLQYDCNKNQLVEKLRRLKKKYRTVVSRMASGKDALFKTPHDQATFEISAKIWSNSISQRPEFDDEDQNPNPKSTPRGFGIDINSAEKAAVTMMSNLESFERTRKRSRMVASLEEKSSRNGNSVGYEAVTITPPPARVSVEDTVRSCLAPLMKEIIDSAGGGGGGGGSKGTGIEALVANSVPMSFAGDVKDERWRRQQIMELEVYSKRLELVQDQIKVELEELRSRGR